MRAAATQARLAWSLRPHRRRMRWAGITNGELLRRAVREFDALLTTDRRMRFQQNVKVIGMRIVVMVAAGNDVDLPRPLIPRVLRALKTVRRGEVRQVRGYGM
jgi:hypothetical protein